MEPPLLPPVGWLTTGDSLTVSVAATESVSPWVFESTARNWWPDSLVAVELISSVGDVEPAKLVPETAVQLEPPSVDICHWMEAGEQLTGTMPSLTLKVASTGAVSVWFAGCSPITGEAAQTGVGVGGMAKTVPPSWDVVGLVSVANRDRPRVGRTLRTRRSTRAARRSPSSTTGPNVRRRHVASSDRHWVKEATLRCPTSKYGAADLQSANSVAERRVLPTPNDPIPLAMPTLTRSRRRRRHHFGVAARLPDQLVMPARLTIGGSRLRRPERHVPAWNSSSRVNRRAAVCLIAATCARQYGPMYARVTGREPGS